MNLPRRIPLSTCLTLFLGNRLTLIGFISGSFLAVFSWSFIPLMDTSFIRFYAELNTTSGVIVKAEEIYQAAPFSAKWANIYEFVDNDKKSQVGYAFTTQFALPINKEVSVEYVKGAPEYSRIPHVRSTLLGHYFWCILLLFLPGLVFILLGFKKSACDYMLLRKGELTQAKFVSKRETNFMVNDKVIYELIFEYTDSEYNTFNKIFKTTHLSGFMDDELRIIFNASRPEKSVLLDDLSVPITVKHSGHCFTVGGVFPFKAVFILFLCVAPHYWLYPLL